MKLNTELNFNVDLTKKDPQMLDIQLTSYDKNNHEFEIEFPGITLDDSYDVTILSVFSETNEQTLEVAEIRDGKAHYIFNTELIHQEDTVVNYVYLKQGEVQAEVMAFEFFVDLSKIDKNAEITAKTYDKNYEQVLEDFKFQLREYISNLDPDNIPDIALDLENYTTKEYVHGLLSDLDMAGYAYDDTELREMINAKPDVMFMDEAEFEAIIDPDPNTFYIISRGGI